MIELEIQCISTGDIGKASLKKWQPQNPHDVWLSMSMEIGEKGDNASNIFLFTLATPEGIRRNLEESGRNHKFGRFYLIVKEYNWKTIEKTIQEKVKRCQSDSWEESVRLLSRDFKWEYEDCEFLDLDWPDEKEESDWVGWVMDVDELLERYIRGERNFVRVEIIRANLSGANLSGTDLSEAELIGAELNRANLNGANLSGAELNRANLIKANLSGAELKLIDLREANLSEAELSEVKLGGADLSGANLSRANLSTANFNRANLSRVNFRESNILLANLSGADLSGADLSGANLGEADLSEADLNGANLNGANLNGANFAMSQVLNVDFQGANLTGCCIEEWNTNSATNFDEVVCDYIYLEADLQERLPHNREQNFAPGEFTRLFQKSPERNSSPD